MKTELPKEHIVGKRKFSKEHSTEKRKLDQIVAEILAAARPQIAKIVLYGSYARGDWVRDHGTGYYSDFDIMIIVKKSQHRNRIIEIEKSIKKRLEKLEKLSAVPFPVKIIIESIKYMNEQLEKGQYFFSDIIKEGVLLYDSGEFEFAKAKDLNREERKQISKDYFEYWFPRGVEFLYGTDVFLQRGSLNIATFQLHQATESFYSAILLVFTAYKKKLHDIEKLGKIAANCTKNKELLEVFPRDSEKEKKRFELLKNAYVDARYDPNYKISAEELLYLISRVEKLKEVTEKICLEWINQ